MSNLISSTVGIVKGYKAVERHLETATAVTVVNNHAQLFELVLRDRVDMIVATRQMGLWHIRDQDLSHRVRALEPPLSSINTMLATSGQAALACVIEQQLRPEVILADYRLPGGDTGLSVIQAL